MQDDKDCRAVITNIQGYSIHDGPGIRTVVFFKGCPLRCRWCANPEGLTSDIQIGFLGRLCANCLKCDTVCTSGAIMPKAGDYRIDRSRCTVCGKCVDACYYGALVRYGAEMSVGEVFDKVRRDKMFYDESGGGVTVSGGEPLLSAGFVRGLFALCREDGINTCVETAGDVPFENIEAVMEYTDYFLFDIKHMDPSVHAEFTGASNSRILRNAERLAGLHAGVLFRQPLIPGVNDGDANIDATAEFLLGLGGYGGGIELMPYHRAGNVKYDALQMKPRMDEVDIMSEAAIEGVRDRYRGRGIACTVSR
jgi:pyruvate formate lyase activating enzyme